MNGKQPAKTGRCPAFVSSNENAAGISPCGGYFRRFVLINLLCGDGQRVQNGDDHGINGQLLCLLRAFIDHGNDVYQQIIFPLLYDT